MGIRRTGINQHLPKNASRAALSVLLVLLLALGTTGASAVAFAEGAAASGGDATAEQGTGMGAETTDADAGAETTGTGEDADGAGNDTGGVADVMDEEIDEAAGENESGSGSEAGASDGTGGDADDEADEATGGSDAGAPDAGAPASIGDTPAQAEGSGDSAANAADAASAAAAGAAEDAAAGPPAPAPAVSPLAAQAPKAKASKTPKAAPKAEKGRAIPDGVYTIASALGRSYVLDVPGASDARGARVQLWRANATPAQMFSFRLGADGCYTVRSVASGLALDVAAASGEPGAAVRQWTPNGTAAQRWEVREGAGGAWLLVCRASGLALTVSGGKAEAGALLVQGRPARKADRGFYLEPVTSEPLSAGYAEIAPRAAASLRVDIAGASRATGADARAYAANSTAAQRFQVVRLSRSVYALRSLASGKYLTQEGSDVIQRGAPAAGPAARQRWHAAWAPGGVSLVNEATGDAMALSGRDVRAAAPRATAAQAWRFRPCVAMAPGTYALLAATGARAGVQGASAAAGADVRMQRPAAAGLSQGGWQKWELAYEGGGWYTLTNAASGMALDAGGASASKAADVRQQKASRKASQRWRPVPTGDGWFWLQSRTGAWLAGTGTGKAGANAVAVTTNRDRKAQKFSFRATAYEASQVRLDVPLLLQLPDYPTGCEAASVAMMLSHAGYDVSIEDVVSAMPYHGSNPDLGFVGNPRTWGGVTIYPPALLGTVRSYTGSAVDLTGVSLDTFKTYLRAGKVIACWIRYGSGLHCVAITGFDEQNFYYNDPYVGKDRPISHADLAAIRAPLGNRALSY